MLMIERRLGGLLRYRKVYFPDRDAALEISRSVLPNELARLFCVFSDLGTPAHLVKHRHSLTAWVDLSTGLEGILSRMKKKSCRYEIRRAEKMLDRVHIEVNSPRALSDFLPLYNGFAEAKGPVPRLPARQFREYSLHGEALVLYLDGRPLCCHLLLCDPEAGIAKLLYSGSRRLEAPEDATACGALNRYLHWHEMQRYCARGFAIYDFGGIRYPEHPTARFKLSFGGAIVSEHYYLLAGAPRLVKLGNLLYEKFFGAPTIASKTGLPGEGGTPGSVTESGEKAAACSSS
jgi:Acetyltransferase (GNAT) domain